MARDKGLSKVNKPSLSQFDSVLNQRGSSSINLEEEDSSSLNHTINLQEEDITGKMGLDAYAKQVGYVEEMPQVQGEEEEGFEAYAKRVEKMMLEGYNGDATQQREIHYLPPSDMMTWPNQVHEEEAGMFGFAGEDGDATGQEQHQDATPFSLLPLHLGEASESQSMMMMTMQNDYNNAMEMVHQEQCQLDNFVFDGGEDLMFDIDDELLNLEDDVARLYIQKPVSQAQDVGGLAAQVMFTSD